MTRNHTGRWGGALPPFVLGLVFVATMPLRLRMASTLPEQLSADALPVALCNLPAVAWRTGNGVALLLAAWYFIRRASRHEDGPTRLFTVAVVAGHLYLVLLSIQALPAVGLLALLIAAADAFLSHRLPHWSPSRYIVWEAAAILSVPAALRLLTALDLSLLESLLFGTGGSDAVARLVSILRDTWASAVDSLRFDAIAWGQPTVLARGLFGGHRGWLNPVSMLVAAALFLLPLGSVAMRGHSTPADRPRARNLLLVAALVAAGAMPGGTSAPLAVVVLPFLATDLAGTLAHRRGGNAILFFAGAAIAVDTLAGLLL